MLYFVFLVCHTLSFDLSSVSSYGSNCGNLSWHSAYLSLQKKSSEITWHIPNFTLLVRIMNPGFGKKLNRLLPSSRALLGKIIQQIWTNPPTSAGLSVLLGVVFLKVSQRLLLFISTAVANFDSLQFSFSASSSLSLSIKPYLPSHSLRKPINKPTNKQNNSFPPKTLKHLQSVFPLMVSQSFLFLVKDCPSCSQSLRCPSNHLHWNLSLGLTETLGDQPSMFCSLYPVSFNIYKKNFLWLHITLKLLFCIFSPSQPNFLKSLLHLPSPLSGHLLSWKQSVFHSQNSNEILSAN